MLSSSHSDQLYALSESAEHEAKLRVEVLSFLSFRKTEWLSKALAVDRIHRMFIIPKIRKTAKAIGKSQGYVSEELKIARFVRKYPEMANLVDRDMILKLIKKKTSQRKAQ